MGWAIFTGRTKIVQHPWVILLVICSAVFAVIGAILTSIGSTDPCAEICQRAFSIMGVIFTCVAVILSAISSVGAL